MVNNDLSNLLQFKLKKERHSLALNPKISSFSSLNQQSSVAGNPDQNL